MSFTTWFSRFCCFPSFFFTNHAGDPWFSNKITFECEDLPWGMSWALKRVPWSGWEAPLYLDFLPAFISVIYEDGFGEILGTLPGKWLWFWGRVDFSWVIFGIVTNARDCHHVKHLWWHVRFFLDGPKLSDGKQPHFDDGSLPWSIIHLRYYT